MSFRFREARKLRGLTLREAGKLLGMSHNGVSKLEKGKLPVDSERLIKVAKAYNVTQDYLIGNNKPKIEFGEIRWFKL